MSVIHAYQENGIMSNVVNTKEDVMRVLEENRGALRSLGILRLGLFGSFVRAEQTASSDIDILAEFEQGQKTFDHFMELTFLLEELFQRPVEVVTPESLSRHIGPHILQEVEYVSFAA